MKKILCVMMTLALLSAVAAMAGCEKKTVEQPSTEPALTEVAAAPTDSLEEDLALPQVNDTGSTTAPLVTAATTTKKFQEAPIMQVIAGAQNAPTTAAPTTAPTTTAPQGNESTTAPEQPTTAPTVTETTKPAATAEQMNNNVLRPIRSGTYTETISAFGNDHSSDDKLSKIVRGDQTAYALTIPAAGLTFKTFSADGKYYLATSGKYCEMTRAQYDGLCNTLGRAFCNFDALQYEKTETVRQGLKNFTCEYFTVNGSTVVLWFRNNALTQMQIGTETLPMTVTGTADSAYFTLDPSLEKVEYESLESLVSLAKLFFGD